MSDRPMLTSVFLNCSSFRDFVSEELTANVKASVFDRFSDGSGMLVFCHDWANGFEGRCAVIDFPMKVAKRILRKQGIFCYDAVGQRKVS